MAEERVFEANQQNFKKRVVERSRNVPVLVDFWAPWCAPCRLLGPVLEEVVAAYNGQLLLAKVNTDENPELSVEYGIQGIPAVKLFVNGTVADQFVGAMPEYEVRGFLKKWVQTESDRLAHEASKLEEEQKWEEALKNYSKALDADPRHKQAWTGRLRVLIYLMRLDEAQAVYHELPTELSANDEIKALQTRMELLRLEAGGVSLESLKIKVDRNPADLEARYQLASLYAAHQKYQEALEELIEILRRESHFQDDAARKLMVKIFELVGVRSPLSEEYREKLARLIY